MKLNLVGSTFSYRDSWAGENFGYSTHGKISKYIKWTTDNSGVATVYVDGAIHNGLKDKRKNKYGWLLESKSIRNNDIQKLLNNKQQYLKSYDIIFTHNKELLDLSDKFKFVPGQGSWIKNPKIHNKTKLVSLISSKKNMCSGHKTRLSLVNKFKNSVDLYGKGFNFISNKEEALNDYMFSIAIENGQYKTYYTEKLLDCFCTGTIPIYLGAPDIEQHFDINGIIILDENFNINSLTPELYYSKMEAIQTNFKLALEQEILEDYIYCKYLKDIYND